jgi:hypothetical protein
MIEDKSLQLVKVSFITEDNEELERSKITDEQYEIFCNELETARLKHKIIWPEMDKRYQVKLNSDVV